MARDFKQSQLLKNNNKWFKEFKSEEEGTIRENKIKIDLLKFQIEQEQYNQINDKMEEIFKDNKKAKRVKKK